MHSGAQIAKCIFVGLCAATAGIVNAQTFTTLYSFCSQNLCADGLYPGAVFIQSTNGDLYGTTYTGGADFYNAYGGTVFKITTGGAFTTLYNFCSQNSCVDGQYPYAGLVQAANGYFYGTATEGGFVADNCGTIFKITPGGTLTTLYSFYDTEDTDGANPYGGLVQATSGDFYGTTTHNGLNGDGTIFRITPAGALTPLYSFCSQPFCTDGYDSLAPLIQGTDGAFYGTTTLGGANTSCHGNVPTYGCGTVFRITADGALKTLYSFCSQSGCTDGAGPNGGLVQGANGNFYGTTLNGGASESCSLGCGTIFKLIPGGAFTTLYSFCSQAACADGASPYDGLVQGTDGNLYGTASFGGAHGAGTIFRITPQGQFNTLYSFCSQPGCADGENPTGGLVQDTNGAFYGAAAFGGAHDGGTVFSLSVGLGPFVKTLPNSGNVGAPVKILGTDLTGATGVTFNGTAAAFTVVSPSEITAVVPTGATSGRVTVVAPSGTFFSNLPFRVP